LREERGGASTVSGTERLIERLSGAAGTAVGRAQALGERLLPAEERALIRRAAGLPLGRRLRLARRLWRDPRVGGAARVPLLVGLAYAVLPVGLLPRRLGPLRRVEKAVGLAALLWLLVRLAPQDVLAEHLDAVERRGGRDGSPGRRP
jgi:uncharacterized membrane protein YkvA (DUF1232 family)